MPIVVIIPPITATRVSIVPVSISFPIALVTIELQVSFPLVVRHIRLLVSDQLVLKTLPSRAHLVESVEVPLRAVLFQVLASTNATVDRPPGLLGLLHLILLRVTVAVVGVVRAT